MGVGTYNDDRGNLVGVVDVLARRRWQAVAAPAPLSPVQLGTMPRQAVNIDAVGCDPEGTCFLVGNYQDSQGNTFGLIDTYRR